VDAELHPMQLSLLACQLCDCVYECQLQCQLQYHLMCLLLVWAV
jgi:hypothetical protein